MALEHLQGIRHQPINGLAEGTLYFMLKLPLTQFSLELCLLDI
jgi:hypothetical protein